MADVLEKKWGVKIIKNHARLQGLRMTDSEEGFDFIIFRNWSGFCSSDFCVEYFSNTALEQLNDWTIKGCDKYKLTNSYSPRLRMVDKNGDLLFVDYYDEPDTMIEAALRISKNYLDAEVYRLVNKEYISDRLRKQTVVSLNEYAKLKDGVCEYAEKVMRKIAECKCITTDNRAKSSADALSDALNLVVRDFLKVEICEDNMENQ